LGDLKVEISSLAILSNVSEGNGYSLTCDILLLMKRKMKVSIVTLKNLRSKPELNISHESLAYCFTRMVRMEGSLYVRNITVSMATITLAPGKPKRK
jgi:hypothetical protein